MCFIGGGWTWNGFIRSCARAALVVVVHRRLVDTCFGGDVARIKVPEKKQVDAIWGP
jgi:hypothetical protein